MHITVAYLKLSAGQQQSLQATCTQNYQKAKAKTTQKA